VQAKAGRLLVMAGPELQHLQGHFGGKVRQFETSTVVSTGSAPPRMRISRTG
jgi:hypothetical protein